jgi:hypothetical protein
VLVLCSGALQAGAAGFLLKDATPSRPATRSSRPPSRAG